MLPKFWIAGRCLTITCSRAIRSAPCVSVTERDHRQELGRQPDGQRHREEQRLERVVLERDAHQQDEQHQDDRRPQDQQAEPPQSALELRLRRRASPAARRCRRTSVCGPVAIASAVAGAADDRGAEEHQCGASGPGRVAPVAAAACLVGRQRLAGQHRLLDGEVARLEQPRVGGHQIAGRQPEDVARHDVAQRRLLPRAVAAARWRSGVTDARRRSAACCDRYDCQKLIATPSTTIVTMISASTALPERAGNRARDEQDDDERIREEVQQLHDGRQAPDGSRLVRAVLGEAPRRLGAAQSLFGARHQRYDHRCP